MDIGKFELCNGFSRSGLQSTSLEKTEPRMEKPLSEAAAGLLGESYGYIACNCHIQRDSFSFLHQGHHERRPPRRRMEGEASGSGEASSNVVLMEGNQSMDKEGKISHDQ